MKPSVKWQCVNHCGACCYLAPEERPFLNEYLDAELLALYHSLVGGDGWCIHFDKQERTCRIYDDRPRFCRVNPEVLETLYGESPADLDAWAIHCCSDHIDSVYGERSPERQHFDRAIGS